MNTEYINNELLKYFLFNLSYDLKRDLNVSPESIKEKLEPIKHYTEEDLSNVYDVYEFLDTLDSLDDFIKSNYDENSLNNSILKDYFTNIYKESYQTEETHKTNVNKQLLKNKALLILQSLYIKSENKSFSSKHKRIALNPKNGFISFGKSKYGSSLSPPISRVRTTTGLSPIPSKTAL